MTRSSKEDTIIWMCGAAIGGVAIVILFCIYVVIKIFDVDKKIEEMKTNIRLQNISASAKDGLDQFEAEPDYQIPRVEGLRRIPLNEQITLAAANPSPNYKASTTQPPRYLNRDRESGFY